MQLLLKDNLPFVTATVSYSGKTVEIPDVLVDTGSASTILSADMLSAIDVKPLAEDKLFTIRGVGGIEVVFLRKVDLFTVGERSINNFEIEIGGMDYGFNINGILGMDFLKESGAVINLHEMSMEYI